MDAARRHIVLLAAGGAVPCHLRHVLLILYSLQQEQQQQQQQNQQQKQQLHYLLCFLKI